MEPRGLVPHLVLINPHLPHHLPCRWVRSNRARLRGKVKRDSQLWKAKNKTQVSWCRALAFPQYWAGISIPVCDPSMWKARCSELSPPLTLKTTLSRFSVYRIKCKVNLMRSHLQFFTTCRQSYEAEQQLC